MRAIGLRNQLGPCVLAVTPCRCLRRVIGDISVRRVAGKLHFAVHQQSFVDVLPQVCRCAGCQAVCCLG